MKKTILIYSGGLDSTTLLYQLLSQHTEDTVVHCSDMLGQDIIINLVDMNVPVQLAANNFF